MAKLTAKEAESRIANMHGWSLNAAGEITKTYTLTNFPQALLFVNAMGLLAEKAQHHPDILVKWNHVTLSLTTHDAGGLTDKDFDLARQIDTLPTI